MIVVPLAQRGRHGADCEARAGFRVDQVVQGPGGVHRIGESLGVDPLVDDAGTGVGSSQRGNRQYDESDEKEGNRATEGRLTGALKGNSFAVKCLYGPPQCLVVIVSPGTFPSSPGNANGRRRSGTTAGREPHALDDRPYPRADRRLFVPMQQRGLPRRQRRPFPSSWRSSAWSRVGRPAV
jgi:hypothetical protein